MRKNVNSYGTTISTIFIVILVFGVIGFLIVSNFKVNEKRTEMTERIEILKREVEELEKKNAQLKNKTFQASQESYWEKKIREQGYQKEGEQQVVVLPPEGDLGEREEEKNLWQKFLEKIGL